MLNNVMVAHGAPHIMTTIATAEILTTDMKDMTDMIETTGTMTAIVGIKDNYITGHV
jgi:hypothetical protein